MTMVPPSINLRETHLIGASVMQRGIHVLQCEPLRARGICNVGWASIAGDYEVVRLCPDFEHLTVCSCGDGLSLIDGNWIPWKPGGIVLSPRGAPHGSRSLPAPTEAKWELSWVTFLSDPNVVPRLPHQSAFMIQHGPQFLRTLLEGLEREVVLGNDTASIFHWVELVARFVDRILGRKSGDSRLACLWNRIQNRIGDPWTVERMAREIGVSGAHLRRLCRSELGFGPNRQLARLRLKHATVLLSRTSMTVEEVAENVGYSDAFAFSTAFRRQMSLSPRQFRQSNLF
jgi:AraC-like DNA-binding protein